MAVAQQSNYAVYDTHKIVQKFIKAGFTKKQAEAFVDEQVELINSNLATKQDIGLLQQDIGLLKKDIELVRKELTITMGKIAVAIVTVLIAFITIIEFVLK